MHAQGPYILPIKGLKTGIHQYELTADAAFFASFPDSPVNEANIKLFLTLDKRHTDMVLDFVFSGTIKTTCDRCLVDVDFPVSGQEQLTVQYSTDIDRDAEDLSLVLISPDEHQLNTAPFAYEFFLLSLPMIKTFDCQEEKPYPCDMDMLDAIDQQIDTQQEKAAEEDEGKPSPWDALKDWNKK